MRNVQTFERDGAIYAHPEYRPDLAVSADTFHAAVGKLISEFPAVFGTIVYDTAGAPYAPPAPAPPASKPARPARAGDESK